MTTPAQTERALTLGKERCQEALGALESARDSLHKGKPYLPAIEAHEALEKLLTHLRAGMKNPISGPEPSKARVEMSIPPLDVEKHREIKARFAARRSKENDKRQRAK